MTTIEPCSVSVPARYDQPPIRLYSGVKDEVDLHIGVEMAYVKATDLLDAVLTVALQVDPEGTAATLAKAGSGDALRDLHDRLVTAEQRLAERALSAPGRYRADLLKKAEGVRLALSYVDEADRDVSSDEGVDQLERDANARDDRAISDEDARREEAPR